MGEFELLRRLRAALPPPPARVHVGVGDDAAVTAGGGALVTSVDLLVEDVHFSRSTATPAQIGHKALAAALSDLAAMGAPAGEAYIAMTIPPGLGEEEFMQVLAGVTDLASATGATLAGGDISAGPVLSLGVTVVGRLPAPDDAVRRDRALAGDVLVVTGELGGAAAGLLLLGDRSSAEIDAAMRQALVARQLTPEPRLEAGRALAAAGARAMIDISDGLAADAGHIAPASGVHLALEADAVPVAAGVAEVAAATGADALDIALGGGEDYELLAALSPDAVDGAGAAVQAVGVPLTVVGEVRGGAGVSVSSAAGPRHAPKGFDQLS
jgi:thiamine-monophosphate kinase